MMAFRIFIYRNMVPVDCISTKEPEIEDITEKAKWNVELANGVSWWTSIRTDSRTLCFVAYAIYSGEGSGESSLY